MSRSRPILFLGIAVLALGLSGCGGGGGNEGASQTTEAQTTTEQQTPAGKTLDGSVGPGFVISLRTPDGQPVSTLAAGTYAITVDDQSDIHNFHLTGPGVDEKTDVGETGTTTWTVKLEAGSYHFQCDPHASTMNGGFEVTG